MSNIYTWVQLIMASTVIISVNAENLAFVTADDKIYKATLPATVGDPIAFTTVIDLSSRDARQLGYDPVDQMLYWADHSHPGKISRCDLNGNNLKDFETVDDTNGVALDIVNRTVYYTARDGSNDNGIYSVDMDLNGPSVRLRTGIPLDDGSYYDVNYITYGLESKQLYYTVEWDYNNGVESINVDGSNRTTLVSEDYDNLDYILAIYLEESDHMLYYGERDFGAIYSINYRQCNPSINVLYAGDNDPYGLTMYKDDLYWCDDDDDVVYRIAKDGSADIDSPVVVPATFDGGALNECRDIHFYIEVPCVSNVIVTSDSSSQLSVTWDLSSVLCLADWYRVEYQPINVDQCNSEVVSPTTLEWQTQNSAMLMDLKAYTTYRISVTPGLGQDSSIIEEGVSVERTQDTGETAPLQSPPGVNYILTDTSVIFTWLEITCGSRGGLIDHYEYKMSSNGVMLASGMDTTREIAVDRPPCGTVTFQVAGVNSAGMISDYTTLSFEIISTDPFIPNTGLQISGITETTADISWEKIDCPPSDYTVKYTLVKLGQCPRNTEFNYGSIGKDQETTATLNSLKPGSEYEVIVCSMNKDGDPRQIYRNVVTSESVPSEPPQNLQITYATGGSAQLTWDAIPCESRGGCSFYYSYKVIVDGVERRSGQTSETSFIELGSPYLANGQVDFVVAGATEAGTGTSSSISYDVNSAGFCSQSCGIHGYCDASTNTCSCRPGYKGERCETSICIAPCFNGGECSDTGSCLCPNGFMGTQCESAQLVSNGLPTSTVEGQFSVISCDGVPAVFTGDLNVEGSTVRDEMLRKIQPLLIQFLGPIAGVIAVGNVRFATGSIVVSFDVTTTSGTMASEIDNGINNLIQSAPALSGLTIDPTSARTFTDAVCPQDYCKNGGTCTVDAASGATGMTCTCANGYVGPQCDDEKEANLSVGAITGIMLGVFAFITGAILVGLCFCMYRRQRQTTKPQLQPNINTLDLATSPYTYPRVDASALSNLNIY